MAELLYKFSPAEGAMSILRFNSMFITSPLDLNDPFEMRPAWTNAHEVRYQANRHLRDSLAEGMPIYVCTETGLVDSGQVIQPSQPEPLVDVELQLGLSDGYNSQVFDRMHAKYRILSLVAGLMPKPDEVEERRFEKSTLMWAHYADQFQGVCIALDPDRFPNGIRLHGYQVDYSSQRRFLPPEEYDSVLRLSPRAAPGIGYVRDHSSGLLLTPEQQRELDEARYVQLLTHKSPAWDYENEVRMIYNLSALQKSNEHKDVWLACSSCRSHRDAVRIPEGAIRGVIFGTDCQGDAAKEILALLGEQRYSHVDLFWSSLHSAQHLIQYTKSTRDYIEFIQQHRSNEIASAKRQVRYGDTTTTVKPSPKGFNYPNWGKETEA